MNLIDKFIKENNIILYNISSDQLNTLITKIKEQELYKHFMLINKIYIDHPNESNRNINNLIHAYRNIYL